jgi:hypothetical protein
MNPEARELLAEAIEADIENQRVGNLFAIAESWDDVYCAMLPIENEIGHPTYGIAFRFWECWGDSACHKWEHYPGLSESDWPVLALEVATAVRGEHAISNPVLVTRFTPKPKVSLLQRVKQWLG